MTTSAKSHGKTTVKVLVLVRSGDRYLKLQSNSSAAIFGSSESAFDIRGAIIWERAFRWHDDVRNNCKVPLFLGFTATARLSHRRSAIVMPLSAPRWRWWRRLLSPQWIALIWVLLAPMLAVVAAEKTAADYFVESLPGAPEGPLLKMHAG